MDNHYLIGTGIYDITGPAAELGMMGWTSIEQRTRGIHSRLFARTFIIGEQSSDKRILIVVTDLWSCTQSVKMEVIKQLGKIYGNNLYTDDNVLICATHTHSGPGGYSHYALYNLAILGFDKQNFGCIVNGIVESVNRAHKNLAPGKIFINHGDIAECGWNRSLKAYSNNPKTECNRYNTDTDKEMLLIKFVKNDGKSIGCLSWFPIHTTNMGEKNELISGDNKGYASYLFEKEMGSDPLDNETFVAAFANSNCGDVSGNVRDGIPDGVTDFARVQEFGLKQYQKAKQLFDSATGQLTGNIDYRATHVDMSDIHIEGTNFRTYPAAIGISMLAGSTEDSRSLVGFTEGITSVDDIEPGLLREVVYPLVNLLARILEGFSYPEILDENLQKGHEAKPVILAPGVAKPYPFTPEVLPIQLIRIGKLLLTGIPAEITTMAGRRLKETLLSKLKDRGVDFLALTAYANAYAGYITTKEEYDTQHYEGASNHFGPYTLMAYQQEFGKLAEALRDGRAVAPGPAPRDLSQKQMTLQTGVVIDTTPLPWIPFGHVHKDVEPSYKAGSTVEVVFWGAHPKNNLRIQDTFLKVQKKDGPNWKTIYTDRDFCTTYRWSRDFIANSRITITWNIPKDAEPGEYRIIHNGNSKGLSGKITAYQGVSKAFTVGDRTTRHKSTFFSNILAFFKKLFLRIFPDR